MFWTDFTVSVHFEFGWGKWALRNFQGQFPSGLPFSAITIRTATLQWNLLMRLAKGCHIAANQKKCLRGSNASRLCPVWRQKGTRAGLFPADRPLHGRQPIYFRRRRLARLNRHCVIQYPLVDFAPCSPTVGLLAPELRDPCDPRIPRCCWKSSLAASRPASARMGWANLDCFGIRETIHGSAGVPLVARSSRDLVGRPSARL